MTRSRKVMIRGYRLRTIVQLSLVLCCASILVADFRAADEATPSRGVQPVSASASPRSRKPIIPYAEGVRTLGTVYPFELTNFRQVVQNSYNYLNEQDLSVRAEVGFTDDAIIIRGTLRDDVPFHQVHTRPAAADWWRITYVADGLEFQFEDTTSASRTLRFVLNFGSRGLDPQVEILASSIARKNAFLAGADFILRDQPLDDSETPPALGVYYFYVTIPIDAVADMRFFQGPLRMSLRAHDMDGETNTYSMMQQVIEKN